MNKTPEFAGSADYIDLDKIYTQRSMIDKPKIFELIHISIINWYLLDREDIPVRGIIAFTGPNGAGKSSVQDGIQALIAALDESKMDFNAQARGNSSRAFGGRSVKDYALGKLDDYGYRRPQGALTRICLGFRHRLTGEKVSIGFAITTEPSQDKYDIEALFIVRGKILTTDDFSRNTDDDTWEALYFEDVKNALVAEGHEVETYGHYEKTKFLRDYLTCLQGRKFRMDAEPNRVRRGFLAAASLEEIKSVSDFARRYVFDHSPIEVADFRESYGKYKSLKDQVERIQYEIVTLEKLSGFCMSYTDIKQRIEAGKWFCERADYINHYIDFRRLRGKAREASVLEQQRRLELDHSDKLKEGLTAQHDTLRAKLAESGIDAVLKSLELREMQNFQSRGVLLSEMQDFETGLNTFLGLRRNSAYAQSHGDLFGIAASASKLLDPIACTGIEAEGVDWVITDLPDLSPLIDKVRGAEQSAYVGKAQAEALVLELEDQKKREGKTGVRVPDAINSFQKILLEAGIETRLLFELIEDVETDWQDPAEAYLGGDRYAIVPEPKDAVDAITILRAQPNIASLRSVRVINSVRMVAEGRNAKPSSLASKMVTSDATAGAIINDRYGDVICIKDSLDFGRYNRVLTQDMTTQTGGMVRRLQPVRDPVLALEISDKVRGRLEYDLAQAHERLTIASKRVLEARGEAAAVTQFSEKIKRWGDRPLKNIAQERDDLILAHRLIEKERTAVYAEVDEGLREEFVNVKKELVGVEEEIKASQKALREAEGQANRAQTALEALPSLTVLQERIGELVRPAGREAVMSVFRDNYARDINLKIGRSADGVISAATAAKSLQGALQSTGRRLAANTQDLGHQRTIAGRRVVTAYLEYTRDFGREPILNYQERLDEIQSGVTRRLVDLVENLLLEYKQKLSDALETVDHMLQHRYLSELSGKVREINTRKLSTNRSLENASFHGEVYRFTVRPKEAYRPLLRLADYAEAAESGVQLSLAADQTSGLEEDQLEALQKLQQLISAPDFDYQEFTDPLEFFDYELEIGRFVRNNTGSRVFRKKTTFTHGRSIRSGGEIQTPYYVVLASAMANLYHGRGINATDILGMGLICLDEVMNKTDSPNMRRFIDYLSEIGLQPILSAPDKERGTFQSKCDTVIDIVKIENEACLNILYPKERLHREYAAQDPREKSIEDFA